MSSLNTPLVDPELFKTFLFWGSILAIKLLAMAALTGRYRFKNLVCINFHFTNVQYKIIIICIVFKNGNYNFYIYCCRPFQILKIQKH